MLRKKIVILGSTGSIGEQALDIVRSHPDRFEVIALSCNRSWKTLAAQVKEFSPRYAVMCDDAHANELKQATAATHTDVAFGTSPLIDLAALEEADIILNALVGFAGFEPTVQALKANQTVALANKESLVVGGALINDLLEQYDGALLPVDSEHSAIYQCLTGETMPTIENLIITASGGPFRTWSKEEMKAITVEQALDHPNWSMGAKITIDSATMMNKGLEVIEARWLFDLPLTKITAVIHPQSVIHSMVTFRDGSSKAQLGPPTMQVPILYAFTYPDRIKSDAPRLNWEERFSLDFEPVDKDKFPCFHLAIQAIEDGGNAPAILNAANEIAVQRFLDKEISYAQIPSVISACLEDVSAPFEKSVAALKAVDEQTRIVAQTI